MKHYCERCDPGCERPFKTRSNLNKHFKSKIHLCASNFTHFCSNCTHLFLKGINARGAPLRNTNALGNTGGATLGNKRALGNTGGAPLGNKRAGILFIYFDNFVRLDPAYISNSLLVF